MSVRKLLVCTLAWPACAGVCRALATAVMADGAGPHLGLTFLRYM